MEHIMSMVRERPPGGGKHRAMCSCGYKSKWVWYPGRAEISWRAHVRGKAAYEAKRGNA